MEIVKRTKLFKEPAVIKSGKQEILLPGSIVDVDIESKTEKDGNDWYSITTQDGKSGYVSENYLQEINTDTYLVESSTEAFKFRGYEWGTPEGVIETHEVTDGMISYFDYYKNEKNKSFAVSCTVSTIKAIALFFFDDNWNLYYGCYSFLDQLDNDQSYFAAFHTLTQNLSALYGEPTTDTSTLSKKWSKMKYSEATEEILSNGANASLGWRADDGSSIVIICFNQAGKVNLELYYVPPEFDYNDVLSSSSDGL